MRKARRRTKGFYLGVLGAGLVCGLIVWFAGRPAYRSFKEARTVARAQAALERGDFRAASVSARQALQINPRNLHACVIMGQLAEAARAPQLIDWRRRLVEIAPTRDNKLLLASTAMRVQPPPCPLAADLLAELAPSCGELPAFHVLSAELALKTRQAGEAEKHFEAAARLDPTNQMHRLNLAVLRLNSTNAAIATEARRTLESLATQPSLGAVALRWLVGDRVTHQARPEALALSTQLLARPEATLEDQLQHLDILKQAQPSQLESFVVTIQKSAETNAGRIYGVSAWLIRQGRANDALQWITNCPAKVQDTQPAPLARVDCYLALKDWAGLEEYLHGRDWDDLEFMRLAFLSQAAVERQDTEAAQAQWRLAVHAAGERLGSLEALLGMAARWKRTEVRESLLWQIAQKYPQEREVARELESVYTAAGNTRALQRLYQHLAAQDPKNFAVRNNLVATSLLLKVNTVQAHETARELFASRPADPVIVSTYAWSLHLQNQTPAALAAMRKLPPEDLEKPAVALYYGLLLSAAGQTNDAPRFLTIAAKAPLLPEEKELVAASAAGGL